MPRSVEVGRLRGENGLGAEQRACHRGLQVAGASTRGRRKGRSDLKAAVPRSLMDDPV